MNRSSLIAALLGTSIAAAPLPAFADCHAPEPAAAGQEGAPVTGDAGDPAVLAEDDGAGDGGGDGEGDGGVGGGVDGEGEGDGVPIDGPEQSAILPSAEGHLESEAPTMDLDCQANPELCSGEPIQTATPGPALSEGDSPLTGTVENPAGEVVVAAPQC